MSHAARALAWFSQLRPQPPLTAVDVRRRAVALAGGAAPSAARARGGQRVRARELAAGAGRRLHPLHRSYQPLPVTNEEAMHKRGLHVSGVGRASTPAIMSSKCGGTRSPAPSIVTSDTSPPPPKTASFAARDGRAPRLPTLACTVTRSTSSAPAAGRLRPVVRGRVGEFGEILTGSWRRRRWRTAAGCVQRRERDGAALGLNTSASA